MKKNLLILTGVLSLLGAPWVSAQTTSITSFTTGLNAFADNATASLPFAAGAGMDWSNAYIGQLLDKDFPYVHLGLGLAVGATQLPTKAVNPLLTALGNPTVDAMGIPFAVVNGRIGGLFLPFDVGFKIGFVPDSLATSVKDYTFTYQNFGLDVRYNVMKSDFALPDISVGAGFNYLKAGATRTVGSSVVYSDGSQTLTVNAPTLALNMSATEFELKGQVSKTFFWILTPYLGAAASLASAHADTGINANVTTTAPSGLPYWNQYGFTPQPAGITFGKDQAGIFGLKLYGGTSVNVFIFKLDLQGMFNVFDGSLGGSVGLRAQL